MSMTVFSSTCAFLTIKLNLVLVNLLNGAIMILLWVSNCPLSTLISILCLSSRGNLLGSTISTTTFIIVIYLVWVHFRALRATSLRSITWTLNYTVASKVSPGWILLNSRGWLNSIDRSRLIIILIHWLWLIIFENTLIINCTSLLLGKRWLLIELIVWLGKISRTFFLFKVVDVAMTLSTSGLILSIIEVSSSTSRSSDSASCIQFRGMVE